MQFSLVFKQLCKEKGVTQQQALSAMGLHRNAVQRWTNGAPSLENLTTISKYFEITVDELLRFGKEEDNDNKKTAIQTDDGTKDNEAEFIKLFLQLSPEEQLRELTYLRDVVNRKDM